MTAKDTITKKHIITFNNEGDHLLTVQDVAAVLRVSVSSLNKWRVAGCGPHFVRVGSRIRYRATDLAAYIARNTKTSTSAA